MLLGAALMAGLTVHARSYQTIFQVPIYKTSDEIVAVAANGLEQQGYTVFQIEASEDYYPDGTEKAYVWVKGDHNPCPDYDPSTPGLQGPYPGAHPYFDPASGVCGWR